MTSNNFVLYVTVVGTILVLILLILVFEADGFSITEYIIEKRRHWIRFKKEWKDLNEKSYMERIKDE